MLGGSIYKAYVFSLRLEEEDNGVIIIPVIAGVSEKELRRKMILNRKKKVQNSYQF
ncbi:MAG: hypothetical protein JSV49_05035 [Thermoplasmata archaeon]|nr:MAG: hypothetical protein JSV49_05035 [Thermoplasmata archaeon]